MPHPQPPATHYCSRAKSPLSIQQLFYFINWVLRWMIPSPYLFTFYFIISGEKRCWAGLSPYCLSCKVAWSASKFCPTISEASYSSTSNNIYFVGHHVAEVLLFNIKQRFTQQRFAEYLLHFQWVNALTLIGRAQTRTTPLLLSLLLLLPHHLVLSTVLLLIHKNLYFLLSVEVLHLLTNV